MGVMGGEACGREGAGGPWKGSRGRGGCGGDIVGRDAEDVDPGMGSGEDPRREGVLRMPEVPRHKGHPSGL